MYGLGGLGQVEVGERRRRAKWLEEKEKEKEEKKKEKKTKDRSVPDGSDKNSILHTYKKLRSQIWAFIKTPFLELIETPAA